jgi:hypothetical protein
MAIWPETVSTGAPNARPRRLPALVAQHSLDWGGYSQYGRSPHEWLSRRVVVPHPGGGVQAAMRCGGWVSRWATG